MRGGKEGERKRKRQKEYLRIDKNIPYLIKKKKKKKLGHPRNTVNRQLDCLKEVHISTYHKETKDKERILKAAEEIHH